MKKGTTSVKGKRKESKDSREKKVVSSVLQGMRNIYTSSKLKTYNSKGEYDNLYKEFIRHKQNSAIVKHVGAGKSSSMVIQAAND